MFSFVQILGIVASSAIGLAAFSVGPAVVWLRINHYEYLLNDSILIPAILFTLTIVIGGLFGNFRRHLYNRPLILGIAGGFAVALGLWLSSLLALAGFAAIIWSFFEDYHVLNQHLTHSTNGMSRNSD